MKNKNTIYVWACDIENYRGEGILGINFLKQLSIISKKKIYVESPSTNLTIKNGKVKKNNRKLKKRINFNFFYNYFYPYYGIIKIYINQFYYSNVCYVNFLPLWNSLLFLLLPKKTIYGPITGSVFNREVSNFNTLIRKYAIPFFYYISLKIICKRKNLLFSTSLLKKYSKNFKSKSFFYDYNLINYKKTFFDSENKDIDFLFYYRKYSAHDSSSQVRIVKKLASEKYKIYVVGDFLKIHNVKNLGIVDRSKIFKYLKRSKFTINEAANYFSIFGLDAISCRTKVFYDKNIRRQQNFFPQSCFIEINLENLDSSYAIIKKSILNYRKISKINFSLDKFKKKYLKYFTNQLYL